MKKLICIYFVFISVKIFSQDSLGTLLTVQNFHLLRNYILTSGKEQKFDLSVDKSGRFVTYHIIADKKRIVIADNSGKLSFYKRSRSTSKYLGDVLLEDNKVIAELHDDMQQKSRKIQAEKKNRNVLLNEFKILLAKTKK